MTFRTVLDPGVATIVVVVAVVMAVTVREGVGSPDPSEARSTQAAKISRVTAALEAVRALALRGASIRPIVFVFEDLHWADEGLVAFVEHLLEWSRTMPILVSVN